MVEKSESQDRYAKLLANSATAVVCANADNIIVSWNVGAERLFGFSATYAIGKPLSIIIPFDRRKAHAAGLARAAKSGQTQLGGKSIDVQALHADGHEISVDLSLSMWFEDGEPMFGALLKDVSDRHIAQQRLEYLAHCDPLTSLPNRHSMQSKITEELALGPCSLLLLDLDGFKDVNDSLGHSRGDELLAAVAERLTKAVAGSGFVARLGGDEFAVLLNGCANPIEIDDVVSRIFESLHPPFELVGQSIFIGTSIGIAMAPHDAQDVEQLLSNADLALYSAKNRGGGVRAFFTRAMHNMSEQKRRLSNELRQALANNEFEIWFQPQFSARDFELAGVEALLRWNHPVHGILTPQIFLDVLDESMIAEEVGDWIIDQVCAVAARWKRSGLDAVRVGVNLFPSQLRTGRLYPVITSALQRHGVQASDLEIEITENTVLRHNHGLVNELKKLRALGMGIAFDDFGTGFASLSLLKKFPLTRLKIDRSFVAKIDRETGDEAIVRAVIGMADSLGLAVIAEGVETARQEAALVRLGCEEVQGYRYGRPMSEVEIVDKWSNRSSLAKAQKSFQRRAARANR